MEGFQAKGGPTPYPHIALCATAPMLISSRRTSCMSSDVQKRCLASGSAAGPEWLGGQNQAGPVRKPTSTPMKTDLNPHGAVITRSDQSHGH
jgi:hypothetical protein